MRRRAAIFLGGTALAGAGLWGVWAGSSRWVLAEVTERAAAAGWTVSVGSVRAGLGSVWLRDVAFASERVPGVAVRLADVEVQLQLPSLTAGDIMVHGGAVEFAGPPDVVAQAFERRSAAPASPSRGSRALRWQGVDVRWRGVSGHADAFAWGVRGESGEELKVAADRVRFALPHVGIDALGVQAKLVRGEGGRRVREANAKQLEVVLSVGSRGTTVAASGVRREGDSGSALALLRGVSLPQLRESIRAVRTRVATLLAPDADISAEPVTLRVQRRKDALSIGPARAELGVDAKGGVNAVLRTSEGGPRAFQVAVRMPTDGSVDLDLVGAKTTLAELGIQDGAFGLQAVADARVAADLKLSWAAGSDELSGTGAVLLENAALAHQALSEHPLTGINLAWRGRWSLATDGSRAVLEGGVLEVGSVPINLDAKLVRSAAGVEGEFRVQVPLASCQALLDSAPRGLLPLLEGVRMAGTFRLDSQVDLVAAQPEKTRARWRMEQDCRPEVLPEAIDPQRFSAAWTREVLGADGRPMQITSGPGTPMWAPLESVTRHMETAVLVCEDGRFFRHRGFDDEAIANSLKQNLAIGKFVRGASTISMQLAKNLYLYREKTLSRKLQEAALTAVLERTLSKQQLMELYLNVIEFGPGIYGIAAAAAFYFDSTPAELSLAQSLYLASLLPKPRAHHFQTDGSLSPAWANYLRRLAHLAHKIKRIDDAELAEALAEEVRFRTRHVAAASAVEETEVEDPAWVGEPEPSL